MKNILLYLLFIFPIALFAQTPVENYPEDPASVEHAGVPKGEIIKVKFENSKIFPGTFREYTIYIPAQYNPASPACVWVNQDAVQFKATTVFDNLINSGEMPVTIGVFVTPGQVQATDEKTALNRYNRSFEYDGLGDAYVRFILEEILPDVEKHKTRDGRAIHLSKNANDRGTGGSSSGAIAAFTMAWERPNDFSRVFSSIGTYVGLRGGDTYPALIRKYEPKPLRMFIQDGSNDNNSYGGDWFKANEMMERSLKFSGYQVQAVYGEGGHNSKMATAVFPQAMRFLWKDYPQPVTTSPSKNDMLKAILLPDEGWEVAKKDEFEVTIHGNTNKGITANNGNQYLAENDKIYLISPNRKKVMVDGSLKNLTSLALTPDQSQLYAAQSSSHWLWLFQIQPDGRLAYKQRFGRLYLPDSEDDAGVGADHINNSIRCDTAGRVYVATHMGVQILDQAGRVNAILSVPFGRPKLLWFGGAGFNILYAMQGGIIMRRKLNTRGANNFEAPVKPNKPKL